MAVCEVTREAASSGSSHVVRLRCCGRPFYPHDDEFQVAVIYRKGIGFSADSPLLPFAELDVSEETRPMIPVRYTQAGQVIRFVACHWTSFDNPHSQSTRRKLADYLRGDTYEFLQPKTSDTPLNRHTVILGDLNEEPTSHVFEEYLAAARDHDSGRQAAHWRDRNQRRVRLYNAAWRYLGEQVAYSGGAPTPGLAGTFYNQKLGWRTLDHLIVSGGLRYAPPPYLDEAHTRVAATATRRSPDGMPRRSRRPGIRESRITFPSWAGSFSRRSEMSTPVANYEQLLREAISQAKVGAPQIADELRKCASQAAEAIAKVTGGAAALDLVSLPRPDGTTPAFQLLLRRIGQDGPPSDLGVYQLSEAGYPIQRWYSRGSWESSPRQSDHLHENKNALEGHFRWMVSNPSSRLVLLVAFILQQAREDSGATKPS